MSLLWLCAWVGPGARADAPVRMAIPPGRETQVQALFAPYRIGDALPGGFRLVKIAIREGDVEPQLVGPEDEQVVIRVTHPGAAAPTARHVGELRMTVLSGGSARAGPAIERLAEAVTRNARNVDTLWFRSMTPGLPPPPPPRLQRRAWALLAVTLVSAALTVFSVAWLVRRSRPAIRP